MLVTLGEEKTEMFLNCNIIQPSILQGVWDWVENRYTKKKKNRKKKQQSDHRLQLHLETPLPVLKSLYVALLFFSLCLKFHSFALLPFHSPLSLCFLKEPKRRDYTIMNILRNYAPITFLGRELGTTPLVQCIIGLTYDLIKHIHEHANYSILLCNEMQH